MCSWGSQPPPDPGAPNRQGSRWGGLCTILAVEWTSFPARSFPRASGPGLLSSAGRTRHTWGEVRPSFNASFLCLGLSYVAHHRPASAVVCQALKQLPRTNKSFLTACWGFTVLAPHVTSHHQAVCMRAPVRVLNGGIRNDHPRRHWLSRCLIHLVFCVVHA